MSKSLYITVRELSCEKVRGRRSKSCVPVLTGRSWQQQKIERGRGAIFAVLLTAQIAETKIPATQSLFFVSPKIRKDKIFLSIEQLCLIDS